MESGLREEGLLEQKYDWYVDRVSISAAALSDKDVRNRIMAWCRHLQTANVPENRGKIDAEMTIKALMQMLTLKSAGALAVLGVWSRSVGESAKLIPHSGRDYGPGTSRLRHDHARRPNCDTAIEGSAQGTSGAVWAEPQDSCQVA
jgi:hypothetical protein